MPAAGTTPVVVVAVAATIGRNFQKLTSRNCSQIKGAFEAPFFLPGYPARCTAAATASCRPCMPNETS
jgi:hypothetical protein